MTGEFVAEVDGERMRLKPGDSLLMPMKVPHRWSVAQGPHCGAIHLYTPAGLMETEWSPVAQSEDAKNQEARKALRARLAFVLISKIYRQMYADTGIATDSARVSRSTRWARWVAKPCQRLFAASPRPHLEVPETWP